MQDPLESSPIHHQVQTFFYYCSCCKFRDQRAYLRGSPCCQLSPGYEYPGNLSAGLVDLTSGTTGSVYTNSYLRQLISLDSDDKHPVQSHFLPGKARHLCIPSDHLSAS
jgi:hypothetical protein